MVGLVIISLTWLFSTIMLCCATGTPRSAQTSCAKSVSWRFTGVDHSSSSSGSQLQCPSVELTDVNSAIERDRSHQWCGIIGHCALWEVVVLVNSQLKLGESRPCSGCGEVECESTACCCCSLSCRRRSLISSMMLGMMLDGWLWRGALTTPGSEWLLLVWQSSKIVIYLWSHAFLSTS